MSKRKTKVMLGKPAVIDHSTLAMSLYSLTEGRLGQVVLSVDVNTLHDGVIKTPPELTEKLREWLEKPGRLKVLKLKELP